MIPQGSLHALCKCQEKSILASKDTPLSWIKWKYYLLLLWQSILCVVSTANYANIPPHVSSMHATAFFFTCWLGDHVKQSSFYLGYIMMKIFRSYLFSASPSPSNLILYVQASRIGTWRGETWHLLMVPEPTTAPMDKFEDFHVLL